MLTAVIDRKLNHNRPGNNEKPEVSLEVSTGSISRPDMAPY